MYQGSNFKEPEKFKAVTTTTVEYYTPLKELYEFVEKAFREYAGQTPIKNMNIYPIFETQSDPYSSDSWEELKGIMLTGERDERWL